MRSTAPERFNELFHTRSGRRCAFAVEQIVDGRDRVRLRLGLEGDAACPQRALGARDGLSKSALVDGPRFARRADVELKLQKRLPLRTPCTEPAHVGLGARGRRDR